MSIIEPQLAPRRQIIISSVKSWIELTSIHTFASGPSLCRWIWAAASICSQLTWTRLRCRVSASGMTWTLLCCNPIPTNPITRGSTSPHSMPWVRGLIQNTLHLYKPLCLCSVCSKLKVTNITTSTVMFRLACLHKNKCTCILRIVFLKSRKKLFTFSSAAQKILIILNTLVLSSKDLKGVEL